MPGAAAGSAMRMNVRASDAPSVREASSQERSTAANAVCAPRMKNGAATNVSATTTPAVSNASRTPASAMCRPTMPPGPSAASRPTPATAGGSTSGSSTSVTTSAWPLNVRVASR